MNKLELFIYFSVYIMYILYSLLAIINVRPGVLKFAYTELADGWKVFGGRRDNFNMDFETYNRFMRHIWPWLVLHYILIQFIRKFYPTKQVIFHAIICALALISTLSLMPVVVILLVILTYYPVRKWENKIIVWLLSILWVILLNYVKFIPEMQEVFETWKYYAWISTCGWTILRCTSFASDYVDVLKTKDSYDDFYKFYGFRDYLGYVLYLPTVTFGPFMSYSRYLHCLAKPTDPKVQNSGVIERNKQFLNESIRCACIWLLMMTFQHFLYISYMTYDLNALVLIKSNFGKFGAGYFMGIFFYLFYRMVYGMGNAFARLDGMVPPANPICIARVNYYSDMWRHFDAGLYEFLFKYIYLNICKLNLGKSVNINWHKMLGMLITYAFVYVWHGCYFDVFIWAFLNMTVIIIEKLYKLYFTNTNGSYHKWKLTKSKWQQVGLQRLEALIGTQIFIIAAFSNLYFIGNYYVGNLMMKALFTQGFFNYLLLVFYSYCLFQCSEFIRIKKK